MDFNNSHYIYDTVCDAVIQAYHFELRGVAKDFRLARIAAYKSTHDNQYNFLFPEGRGIQICLLYVVPAMIGLRIYDMEVNDDFIQGKDYRPLVEIADVLKERFFDELLNDNETFDTPNEKQTQVTLDDKIKEFYNAVFIKQYIVAEYCTAVGKYTFS